MIFLRKGIGLALLLIGIAFACGCATNIVPRHSLLTFYIEKQSGEGLEERRIWAYLKSRKDGDKDAMYQYLKLNNGDVVTFEDGQTFALEKNRALLNGKPVVLSRVNYALTKDGLKEGFIAKVH